MASGELIKKASRFKLSEEDIREILKEVPEATEKDFEEFLDEMEKESRDNEGQDVIQKRDVVITDFTKGDSLPAEPPQEGDVHIYEDNYRAVYHNGRWVRETLIKKLQEAMNGTFWILSSDSYPLVLYYDCQYTVEIPLYCDTIDTCFYEVVNFIKKFDYRTEAWKYASVDETGFLTSERPIDDPKVDLNEIWIQAIELAQNMRKIINKKKGELSVASFEDLQAVRYWTKGWDVYSVKAFSDRVFIFGYSENGKILLKVPVYGGSVYDCCHDIYSYFKDFDMNKEAKGYRDDHEDRIQKYEDFLVDDDHEKYWNITEKIYKELEKLCNVLPLIITEIVDDEIVNEQE